MSTSDCSWTLSLRGQRAGSRCHGWPVTIDLPFLVLYVDSNYQYALFGEQDRALGWIYARSPVISELEYRELLARFSAVGYDAERFRKVIQTPEQIGRPGFWNEGIDR
jgi:apolipoprotein D and lipocalin family protein